MSAADLLAVLVGRHLRYDWDTPHADNNDHLIFSKGHASPLLYSIFKDPGWKATPPLCCRGSMSPRDRLARDCLTGWA